MRTCQPQTEAGQLDHAVRRLADFIAIAEEMAMRKKPEASLADHESIIAPYSYAGLFNGTGVKSDAG